ncbi:MAG TPA: hypothetical protein VFW94_23390 [Candidatus Acidoferrales bacterium]|nr:hypothetical protein [Candidatus Acidoferrales bacterium]
MNSDVPDKSAPFTGFVVMAIPTGGLFLCNGQLCDKYARPIAVDRLFVHGSAEAAEQLRGSLVPCWPHTDFVVLPVTVERVVA